MKIIIVGAGAVGSIVAERLSRGENDVTLIEADEQVVSEAQEHLDALVLQGNGATIPMLQQAGVEKTEILIAGDRKPQPNRGEHFATLQPAGGVRGGRNSVESPSLRDPATCAVDPDK